MNTDPYERMMSALSDGSGRVELDAFYAQSSSTYAVAKENSANAALANERGDRCAFLYTAEYDARISPEPSRPAVSATVTREQAQQLLRAGAKWIGPDIYAM